MGNHILNNYLEIGYNLIKIHLYKVICFSILKTHHYCFQQRFKIFHYLSSVVYLGIFTIELSFINIKYIFLQLYTLFTCIVKLLAAILSLLITTLLSKIGIVF